VRFVLVLDSVTDKSIAFVGYVTDNYDCRLIGGLISYVVHYSVMWAEYGLVEFQSRIGLKEMILTSEAMP
jgi:hypothetical protein